MAKIQQVTKLKLLPSSGANESASLKNDVNGYLGTVHIRLTGVVAYDWKSQKKKH